VEISPESFDVIESLGRFALHGTLLADYSADTLVIDESLGVAVRLDGPDTEIEEQMMFDGLTDQLLVFVNNEVMSVVEAQVIGASQYRLSVVRGRFATPLEAHSLGDDAFIVRRDELEPLQHAHFVPGNTVVVKVQAFTGKSVADLGDAPELSLELAGRIYRQTPPTNLRVNGDGVAPSYTSGQGVVIEWTLTDAGALPWRSDLLARSMVVDFYNASGTVLLGTTTTPAGSLSLTNAELQTLLGGAEVSFQLRVRMRTRSDWWELDSATVTLLVTKL
jgi:hypothetical protein